MNFQVLSLSKWFQFDINALWTALNIGTVRRRDCVGATAVVIGRRLSQSALTSWTLHPLTLWLQPKYVARWASKLHLLYITLWLLLMMRQDWSTQLFDVVQQIFRDQLLLSYINLSVYRISLSLATTSMSTHCLILNGQFCYCTSMYCIPHSQQIKMHSERIRPEHNVYIIHDASILPVTLSLVHILVGQAAVGICGRYICDCLVLSNIMLISLCQNDFAGRMCVCIIGFNVWYTCTLCEYKIIRCNVNSVVQY